MHKGEGGHRQVQGWDVDFQQQACRDASNVNVDGNTGDLSGSGDKANSVELNVGDNGQDESLVAAREGRNLGNDVDKGQVGVEEEQDGSLNVEGSGVRRAEVQQVVDEAQDVVDNVGNVREDVGEEARDGRGNSDGKVGHGEGGVQVDVEVNEVELPARVAHSVAEREGSRHVEAEELNVQVMETRKRVLGPEHPDTLSSMANLASTFGNKGRWDEAEELFVQVIETFKRALGSEHPSTLNSMWNLAHTYKKHGKDDEAIGLQRQVVAVHQKVLGSEHPYAKQSTEELQEWIKR